MRLKDKMHCFGDRNCKKEATSAEEESSGKRKEHNSAGCCQTARSRGGCGQWGRTRVRAVWWPPHYQEGLWWLFLHTETRSTDTSRNLSTDWNKLWLRPEVQRRNPKENKVWKKMHCEATLDEKSTETTPLIFLFMELFKNQVPSFAQKFHLREVSKTTTTQQQSDYHSRDTSLWHRFENY